MKTLLLAIVALTSFLPNAQAATDVTVTLEVDLLGAGYKTCEILVPQGADGGDVLDAGVAQGCLLAWGYAPSAGYGRYVTQIDHVPGLVATYWAFYLNGAYSDVGIDAYEAAQGDVVRFNYEQWVVGLP